MVKEGFFIIHNLTHVNTERLPYIGSFKLFSFDSCCVKKWEDPHDSTVYCVESDKKWMILSGTYRYGVVRGYFF
jgi:hypothetical protein